MYKNYVHIQKIVNATPRPMIQFLKQYMKDFEVVGVEIGVSKGHNAQSILQELNVKRLYLIDPYLLPLGSNSQKMAHQNLSQFQQVIFIKKTSDEAIRDLTEKLDFVYVDGCHKKECVKNDLLNYLPLLKLGGVIGGHDYPLIEGVKEAVDDFRENHKELEVSVKFPDWWIIKT
jgi:predicted O-methyltransferase YrrM